MQHAVVIPVKAFGAAKARLASALEPGERAELARTMATTVVRAAGDLPVTIVCDDPAVREWAEGVGATVCWSPGLGLDGAVTAGVEAVRRSGATRAAVVHADLPFARDLGWTLDGDGVLLVPDRHRDGTNVITVPTSSGFRFAYGPRSFERHRAEAVRLGLGVRILDDSRLGWDVDNPEDLEHPTGSVLRS